MDKQAVGVGVGGATVVGVGFGMARYAYGLTLPDVRSAFGLSELLLGLMASATFAGYLIGLVCVSVGGLATSIVEPRQVFKTAILANAAAVIFAPELLLVMREVAARRAGRTRE